MQLSPIERYALHFVEATGEAWTAESLRLAEAEIEAQKKEWEANRLATIQKQEEELQKMEQLENEGGDEYESDDDVMLTYSREDAMNQVNNKSKSLISKAKKTIINKRLARVKEQEAKKDVKNRQLPPHITRRKNISQSKRKTRKRPSNISPSTSKAANGRDPNFKKRKIDSNNRRITRSSPTKTSPNKNNAKKELVSSSNSDGDDENESENEEKSFKNGEAGKFNSSDDETTITECSLDVMLHDTTTNSTNYNKSDSENLSSKENPYSDYDEKDDNPLPKNKSNLLDVNSPRTRSRGSVKINLWTLDESPILPSRSVIHNKKDSSQNEEIKELASTPKNNKNKQILSNSAGSPKKKVVNFNGKQKPPIPTGNSSLLDRWVVKTPRTNLSPSPVSGRRVTRLSSTFNNTS